MTRVRSALRPMRQHQGIQPRELAARVGIGRQALSELEAGKACPSTAVALALRCKVEDLFALSEDSEPIRANWVCLFAASQMILGQLGFLSGTGARPAVALTHGFARRRRNLGWYIGVRAVTHDAADAIALGRQVAILERGKVVQRGTYAQIQAQPRTPFVAEFVSAN